MSVLLSRDDINPVPAALYSAIASAFSFALLFVGIKFLAPSTSYARDFLNWLLEIGVWYAALPVFAVMIVQGLYTYRLYRSAEIALAGNKLTIKIGVFNLKEKQIPLDEIRYTSTYANVFDSRFGVKDIKIYTSGTAGVSGNIVGVKQERANAIVSFLQGEAGTSVA